MNDWVYGQAPWGSLIELISYSSGIHYPENSEAERWTPEKENANMSKLRKNGSCPVSFK